MDLSWYYLPFGNQLLIYGEKNVLLSARVDELFLNKRYEE